MIEVTDSSRDKRLAEAKRAIKAIDRAGGVPEDWQGNTFKYLGHTNGKIVFAVRDTVAYIADGVLKEARTNGEL